MADSRVIIASNRLPVNVKEDGDELTLERSVGGLATALASVFENGGNLWVGWPGSHKPLTKQQMSDLSFPDRLVPITMSGEVLHRYYDRLANGVLWPIMHGLRPTVAAIGADWKALREISERFVTAIRKHVQPSDIIWVHDYHLILLPQLLREAGIRNRIGFFLHTPFPPAKTLMQWPEHRQLLKSLSMVDVLGFQTPRDVANFRVNLAATGMTMSSDAVATDFPIGVDYNAYREADRIAKVKGYIQKFKKRLAGKHVILSVSRLDYTKGIIEQLRAVERLLETRKFPSRIMYKLIVAPSREDVDAYRHLKEDIEKTVNEINARFGRKGYKPVDYSYRSHGFNEVNAWFRIADVLLVTPRIDGMNLVVKEYIATRKGSRGMLVFSETIGAAVQLKDAVLVEPLNIESIANGLKKALTMSPIEREKRWRSLKRNVKKQDVFWWSDQFLSVLRSKN